MKTWMKVGLVALLFGIPAFLIGPSIWPPSPENPMPTATQLPLFIVIAVLEAVVFGLGVAFIIFGYPLARRLAGRSQPLAWATYISIAWLTVSWWPHDNSHLSNGSNMSGLLVIEYVFHVTLMLTGLVLAYAFVRNATRTADTTSAMPAAQGGELPAPQQAGA